jgi:hypothetical protein
MIRIRNDYSGSGSDTVKQFRIWPDPVSSAVNKFNVCEVWTYLVVRIHHGCVATRAELRIELEELLVSEVKEIDLRVVEGRVHVLVQLPVPVYNTQR